MLYLSGCFLLFSLRFGFSLPKETQSAFFKDSNSVMVGPKEAELYLKWRLQLPCSAVNPKFAEIMRLMKSYEVCNAAGNTDLSTYIGRRGLGEKNLTSLVMSPDKGGEKGLWREWIHLVCWGTSLAVIMVPWEQCSRVFSCHFFSGLCHFFWTWRSMDSGFLAQAVYLGVCFMLFCLFCFFSFFFLWQINTLWQTKCDFFPCF